MSDNDNLASILGLANAATRSSPAWGKVASINGNYADVCIWSDDSGLQQTVKAVCCCVVEEGDIVALDYLNGKYRIVGVKGGHSYTLPSATPSALGGIIVGDNLEVTVSGKLRALAVAPVKALYRNTSESVATVGNGWQQCAVFSSRALSKNYSTSYWTVQNNVVTFKKTGLYRAVFCMSGAATSRLGVGIFLNGTEYATQTVYSGGYYVNAQAETLFNVAKSGVTLQVKGGAWDSEDWKILYNPLYTYCIVEYLG